MTVISVMFKSLPPKKNLCLIFSALKITFKLTTGDPNTLLAVKINVLLFSCVPVSFFVNE